MNEEQYGEWIEHINENSEELTPWEQSFMESITDQFELSPRQAEILERIYHGEERK